MDSDSTQEEITETIEAIIQEEKPQTVKKLVEMSQERFQVPKEDLIEIIMKLRREGKIKLREHPKPLPTSFSHYLKTRRARWFWATIALAATTTLTVLNVPEQLFPLVYVRYLLGTIYVLWLPGYTLIKLLFPQTTDESVKGPDTIERTALSIGLSIALVPLIGILLNYTPWGIRLTPIVLSLLILIIIFSTTAVIREQQANIRQQEPSSIRAEGNKTRIAQRPNIYIQE